MLFLRNTMDLLLYSVVFTVLAVCGSFNDDPPPYMDIQQPAKQAPVAPGVE